MNKNWFSRNWKWFVPAGCIGIIILFILIGLLFIIMIFSFLKSSEAYQDALSIAQNHPEVQEALGYPIKDSFFVQGNIHTSGQSGNADYTIPVKGPLGQGTIYVQASKSSGIWTYSVLIIEIKESGQRINLLEDY